MFLGGQNGGKTAILRRYFHGNFSDDGWMSTIGVDVYSTITTITPSSSSSKKKCYNEKEQEEGITDITSYEEEVEKKKKKRPISIQVWDTPGVNPNTATFSDKFLINIDAAVLVYDVSSSTSFTHVLNWYYELIERIRRMKTNHQRTRHLPIVIVGNKIDIFQDRDSKQKELRRKKVAVKQRNVLGLTGNWRGREFRYEYSVKPISSSSAATPNGNSNNDDNSNIENGKPNRLELLTYLGTNTNYLEAILNNEVYRGSYLDSLLSSEANSHTDLGLVRLWCLVRDICI